MDEDFNPLMGMLEVVMEEDDSEVYMPSDSYDLPPVPTFDLQTEQFPMSEELSPRNHQTGKVPIPRLTASKSMKQVSNVPFRKMVPFPEASKVVCVKPDEYPKDLSDSTFDEMNFHNNLFRDIIQVTYWKLHCTVCDKHLGCSSSATTQIQCHRMLKVLICRRCFKFYGDGNFPTDSSDKTEIYCRWCAQGGDLVCCSFCCKVFCYKCIIRNFGSKFLQNIQKANDWACFCCAQKPLWPLRAVCRALLIYIQSGAAGEDTSVCCEKSKYRPKTAATTSPTPVQSKSPAAPMVVIPSNSANIMRPFQNLKPQPFSQMTAPIRRGQTIITPPANMHAAIRDSQIARKINILKPPPPPPTVPTPPRQPNSKLVPSNMPEVRIDHSSIDSTVVRLKMANAKEQYLRVNIVGNCMRIPAMPQKPSFVHTSLLHCFRLEHMAFAKFKLLNDGFDDRNLTVSAQKLQSTLTKFKELISQIEDDLAYNVKVYEKQEMKKTAEVIDVDDDDYSTMRWNFVSVGKNHFIEEADVEVIDCDETPKTVLPKPPVIRPPVAKTPVKPPPAKKRKPDPPRTPPTRKLPKRNASLLSNGYNVDDDEDEAYFEEKINDQDQENPSIVPSGGVDASYDEDTDTDEEMADEGEKTEASDDKSQNDHDKKESSTNLNVTGESQNDASKVEAVEKVDDTLSESGEDGKGKQSHGEKADLTDEVVDKTAEDAKIQDEKILKEDVNLKSEETLDVRLNNEKHKENKNEVSVVEEEQADHLRDKKEKPDAEIDNDLAIKKEVHISDQIEPHDDKEKSNSEQKQLSDSDVGDKETPLDDQTIPEETETECRTEKNNPEKTKDDFKSELKESERKVKENSASAKADDLVESSVKDQGDEINGSSSLLVDDPIRSSKSANAKETSESVRVSQRFEIDLDLDLSNP